MKATELSLKTGFAVSIGNAKSQAAVMVVAPGAVEGGPENRHRGADQWMYVISGNGTAVINGGNVPLEAGRLVLIEAGDGHEIRNNGTVPLKTINFYVPPAYDQEGNELPPGRA